jgi:chromosome segregation ATPase
MPEEADSTQVDSYTMSSDEEPKPKQEKKPAPKPAPSTAEIENKVKIALTQTEKRLVDLELGLAEFKEAIMKFSNVDQNSLSMLSELPDLKQRLEDLEDLVMIESAGIEELKDVMEEVRDRIKQPQSTQPEEATQKNILLGDIESKLSYLDQMKRELDDLAHEVATMKQGAIQITEAPSSPPQDNQLLSAKIENVKTVVDELIKRKVELDMKIEKIEKTVSLIQTRGPNTLPDDLKKEMDTLNRSLSVLDSRMDAIESVSKDLSDDMKKLKVSVQKFDTFEKASNLAKELQTKMEEFKFIEDEVKRISNRVEGFYENLDQKLDKIREFDRIFPQLNQEFYNMKDDVMKRFDENKIMILDRATKDETSQIRDRISQLEAKLSNSQLKDMESTIERMKQDMQAVIKDAHEPLNVINIEISDILARIVGIETRLSNIERIFQLGKSRPVIIE